MRTKEQIVEDLGKWAKEADLTSKQFIELTELVGRLVRCTLSELRDSIKGD